MRVLWLCNIVFPPITDFVSSPVHAGGGWLSGAFRELIKSSEVKIGVCFPFKNNVKGETNGVSYYGFSSASKEYFIDILQDYNPELIHIFGTEFPHTFDMMLACKELGLENRVVISLQGLISVCESHYYAFLPEHVIHAYTFRDFLKQDNICLQRKKFKERGMFEIKTLQLAKHVIGRTEWDKACAERINPDIKYYYCGEILRSSFYDNSYKWSLDSCEKHSIFVSQSNYPIKGFHLILEAMSDIIKRYPDAHLYTTGESPLELSFSKRMRQSYYSRYLGELITSYGLENSVSFLGRLNEKEMCDRYLKSHVFCCCSAIENSPNSVGEAMLLGVPVVSSNVGGINSLLLEKKEGLLFPADEPYMASYYIMQLFENDNLARNISHDEVIRAKVNHNREYNSTALMCIYNNMLKY